MPTRLTNEVLKRFSPMDGLKRQNLEALANKTTIQTLEAGRLTSRQIEAGRMAITRKVKRQGKLWIRVFPDKPMTKKPLEVRMGSGKGAVDHWVAIVKPGRVLFEISGVTEQEARDAFRMASAKLPVSTRVLARGVL